MNCLTPSLTVCYHCSLPLESCILQFLVHFLHWECWCPDIHSAEHGIQYCDCFNTGSNFLYWQLDSEQFLNFHISKTRLNRLFCWTLYSLRWISVVRMVHNFVELYLRIEFWHLFNWDTVYNSTVKLHTNSRQCHGGHGNFECTVATDDFSYSTLQYAVFTRISVSAVLCCVLVL